MAVRDGKDDPPLKEPSENDAGVERLGMRESLLPRTPWSNPGLANVCFWCTTHQSGIGVAGKLGQYREWCVNRQMLTGLPDWRDNAESSILWLKAVEEPDPCHQQLTFQR